MSALARTVALCLLTLGALPVLAANRCAMPGSDLARLIRHAPTIGSFDRSFLSALTLYVPMNPTLVPSL